MREAGISAADCIRMATVETAKLLGVESQLGTIESGKRADIIGVSGDAIEDIEELLDVDFVMKDGMIYKQAAAPEAPRVGRPAGP